MSLENMRVIALGGCGDMGKFAVRQALTYDFVKEIVVADLDGERARDFAEKCGSKASPAEVDVADASSLARLVSGADVIMTTVGPYYRFGVPILRAAIQEGCHYIDINDDWEPTLEMLDLDDAAKEAGISALIGMGASPGQSNMLAAKAMNLLDTVEELITGWGLGGDEESRGQSGNASGDSSQAVRPPSPSAALIHWLHQCSGNIRVLHQGHFIDVPPLQEIKIEYPGIGLGTAYTVGHPEPLTIPRFRTELKTSCNVMVVSPRVIEILRGLAVEIDAGRITVEEAALMFNNPQAAREDRGSESRNARAADGPRLPGLFTYASGMKDGKKTAVGVTVSAGVGGGMGGATGVPMAIGLAMLGRRKITRKGVFAPEAVIDPDDFFNELGPLCSDRRAGSKDMLLIGSIP
ncbi:MAG: saccharopine dehydrogenase NADP-binding domain-containing protein [Deltaproteobacteria bacterium]|nr:saccharopine dehydrogenase NADP-binding domain-containing protein [Deltaproteobacteria bacterium]